MSPARLYSAPQHLLLELFNCLRSLGLFLVCTAAITTVITAVGDSLVIEWSAATKSVHLRLRIVDCVTTTEMTLSDWLVGQT